MVLSQTYHEKLLIIINHKNVKGTMIKSYATDNFHGHSAPTKPPPPPFCYKKKYFYPFDVQQSIEIQSLGKTFYEKVTYFDVLSYIIHDILYRFRFPICCD